MEEAKAGRGNSEERGEQMNRWTKRMKAGDRFSMRGRKECKPGQKLVKKR